MVAAHSATSRWTAVRRLLPAGRRLPDDVWWQRHRGILVLLWAHAVAIPAYGLYQGYSLQHIGLESLIVPVTALSASLPRLDRRARTATAALGLLSCSAILVHLSHGLIEMHFHFFVMVAVVALYQDWVPFLAAIAYVFLHHGVMGVVDGPSVYNHPDAQANPWRWAAVHAFFITGTSIACLVTWSLNERILEHNEELYESERAARLAAEEAGAGLTLLADATRVLTSSMEVDTILRDLATLVAPGIADYCLLDIKDDAGRITRYASAGPIFSERAIVLEDQVPDMDDAMHAVVRCLRSGVPLVLTPAPPQLLGLPPDFLADTTAEAPRSTALVVPILDRAEVLGTMSLVTISDARRLGEADLPVVAELARRTGIAIANARLFARQRTVAETLQHSLLPDRLPDVPGIESAARYIAGGSGVDIGGDWYDLIQLPGGRLLMTMGDVVGKGERAAALMGQLRNALRAFSLVESSPCAIIRNLNRLLHDLERSDMATMLCGILEPETGLLRICNAGHPPPAILGPDGAVRFLDEVSGPPIGAVPRAAYDDYVTTLDPGTTVVLYTDGLVEDRRMSLDAGLARLRGALTGAPQDLEELTDAVLAQGVAGREAADDVAMLAVRLIPLGTNLAMHLPTSITTLEPLRATLRRWLSNAGATEEETYEILVAISEACANAIVHARGPASGTFDVSASLDDEIRVEVRDHGTWRSPRPSSGGRGLHIMESFMDDVQVTTDATGTVVSMRRRLGTRLAGVS